MSKLDGQYKMPIMMVLGIRGHFVFGAVQQNSDSGQNALHQAGECLAVSLAGRLLDEERFIVKGGIYQFTNLRNGKRYIGSAVNLRKRWRDHLSALRRGKHANPHLQAAFGKYGEKAFAFSVLEYIEDSSQLIVHEQHFLDDLRPEYNLYLTAGSPLGYQHTAEAKCKIGIAHRGRQLSEEHRRKISEAQRGQLNHMYGKRHSLEACLKMRAAQMGHLVSTETRRKIGLAQKARPVNKETRRKISAGLRKYWRRRAIEEESCRHE